MKKKFCPKLRQIEEALVNGEDIGFCRHCGAEAYGVESDAREYKCQECGAHQVYGAEEFIINDWVEG